MTADLLSAPTTLMSPECAHAHNIYYQRPIIFHYGQAALGFFTHFLGAERRNKRGSWVAKGLISRAEARALSASKSHHP